MLKKLAANPVPQEEDIPDNAPIPFSELGASTKRRKSAELRSLEDPDLILKAAHQIIKQSNHHAGIVFEKLIENPNKLGIFL